MPIQPSDGRWLFILKHPMPSTFSSTSKRLQWQQELAQAIKSPSELLQALELTPFFTAQDEAARSLFPLLVPKPFVEKMQKGNPRDPLFLQAMCRQEEFQAAEGFVTDPLDEQHPPVPNILHKYKNRLLFMIKNSCAINCRYCFRRHFPYHAQKGSKAHWQQALTYIANHPDIEEVVFSGGDPMMASDHEWNYLFQALSRIPHVQRLRIHSRLPVVLPSRITEEFCALCQQWQARFQIMLVTHINHCNEIDETLANQLKKLKNSGVTLLNQSVFLKGVNDNAATLKALSDALFKAGILPYYLHLLDKVAGASHFYVPDDKALAVYRELQAITSGYLVPKLAREIGGEKNKTLIS